jgi:transcriptional regulator with XRE-family HTH domain
MSVATYDAMNIIAVKFRSRGISANQFAALVGVSNATMSRWISGEIKPSDEQTRLLRSTVEAIDYLFNKLHPIRPDFSSAENARTVLKLVRDKKLWVGIHAVGYEEALHLTRDEIETAQTNFEAGIAALATRSLNGSSTDSNNSESS